jgi:hypothetical protein
VTDHKFLEDVHEDSLRIPRQKSHFLCNRSNEPLKASGYPTVPRSFSIEDVRTSGKHHPNARSSFSNFYTKLNFNQHYLGSFCKMSGRYPAFQNISGFFFKNEKELHRRPSGRSAKPSERVPVMRRITLFWKAIAEDRSDEANFHLDAR